MPRKDHSRTPAVDALRRTSWPADFEVAAYGGSDGLQVVLVADLRNAFEVSDGGWSASMARCGSTGTGRDFLVLVSPPARTERTSAPDVPSGTSHNGMMLRRILSRT